MSFFPLPQKADLYRRKTAPTVQRSGQILPSDEFETTPVLIKKCLFYSYTGHKDTSPRKDFSQFASFYCEPGAALNEGDIIKNIRGRNIFEAGPFEVENVRYVPDFTGRVHHISCKLKGITG